MLLANDAKKLKDLLGLRWSPVAVAFRDEVPAGVSRVGAAAPSGCTYWKMAGEGKSFYTEASDHMGCPVGAHTHGIAMSEEQTGELHGLIGTMVGLQYLKMEEVPAIPTIKRPFVYAVYAPLEAAVCEPDVVILRGNARQLMVATEAARAAGMEGGGPVRERPTCAMIPEAMSATGGTPSFACIGNRVYTALADEELYFAIPGDKVAAFVDKLAVLVNANQALEAFHRGRLPVLHA